MEFRRIRYLEWLTQYLEGIKYDLASGGLRPLDMDWLQLTLGDIHLDGKGFYRPLLDTLAERYKVEPSRIFITNGATMAIYLLYMTMFKPGDEILLESPNYEPLYRLAILLGVRTRMLDRDMERGFQLDLEQLERKISKKISAVVITNPHNPSGVYTDPDKLMTIGQIARDYKAQVICDEVYLDNLFKGEAKPAVSYGTNMITVNSLSKVYGLAGLRIGWIIASENVIRNLVPLYNYVAIGLSWPSQAIATVVIKRADEILSISRQIVTKNLQTLQEWIGGLEDLRWIRPDGGTVCFIKLPPGMDDVKFCAYLRDKYNTLVVPGDFFWARGFIRVNLGGDPEIFGTGLKHLADAMNELKRLK